MAVKIKLKRMGKIRAPYYRIIVADARNKRDGRAIEEVGIYQPIGNPSRMEVNAERVAYWLSVGAQPTETVLSILRVTGDWQKFKGLPAPKPMKVPEPKADKKAIFEAAAKESGSGSSAEGEAITPKAKKADKSDASAGEADQKSAESAASTPAEG